MADSDVKPSLPWPVAVRRFESLLSRWHPAVGLPFVRQQQDPSLKIQLPRSGPGLGVASNHVFNFDHTLMAVHAEAAPRILPYNASLDATCWWVALRSVTLLSLALFRNHVLLFPAVQVTNPSHSEYSKVNCQRQEDSQAAFLRSLAPPHAQNCFPDSLHGLRYFPWGVASSKSKDVSYANATVDMLSSCGNEPVLALAPRPAWCQDCDTEESIRRLQLLTLHSPMHAPFWNELGIWLVKLRQYAPASACFHLSRKILQYRSASQDFLDPALEANIVDVRNAAATSGAFLSEDPWSRKGSEGLHPKFLIDALLGVETSASSPQSMEMRDLLLILLEDRSAAILRSVTVDRRSKVEKPNDGEISKTILSTL
eukprot:TRINITY_DN15505_c0_g1_i1.p1 TRINITY_DN15505_c0_g1~~TRINITY_DN15505_c0_g1_i1.p1  ORF type:complete len:393 (-),score=41.50 TRINITY_DN15505_c0_g1_i1:60-1169(-)